MKKYFKNSIVVVLLLSLLFIISCEENVVTDDDQNGDTNLNNVDVTLIDTWDLFRIENDGVRDISLIMASYLIVKNDSIIFPDTTYTSNSENTESIHMIDNQIFTVTSLGDTLYHYDYFYNSNPDAPYSNVLWLIEENSSSDSLAVDPTLDETISEEDYLLLYVHNQGPIITLTEPTQDESIPEEDSGDDDPDNDDLKITFKWKSNGASEYLLQVRTDGDFGDSINFVVDTLITETTPDGAIVSYTYLENFENFATYYWRVKADNSGWSEIWNFETCYVVNLTLPQTNKSVCKRPNLSWDEYENAIYYILVIDTTSTFDSDDVIEVETTATEYVHDEYFINDIKYFWKVLADNAEEHWSNTFNFTIDKSVTTITPAENGIQIGIPVNFSWEELDNAINYSLEISAVPLNDETQEFDDLLIEEENILENSFQESDILESNNKYYWRVHSDVATNWCAVDSFLTNTRVALESPINNSIDLGTLVEYRWYDLNEYEEVNYYTLQVSEDENFNNILIEENIEDIDPTDPPDDGTDMDNSCIPVYDLNVDFTYYWRVKADNIQDWSDTWSFTTRSISGNAAVTLSSPGNADTTVIQLPKLQWNTVEEGKYYYVQLSDSDNFDNLIVNKVVDDKDYYKLIDNESSVSEMLDFDTTYYWRVKTDANDCWSEVYFFETGIHLRADVNPKTPNKIDLDWIYDSSLVNENLFYSIECSTDSINWEEIDSFLSYEREEYCDLNKDINTTYYYRMRLDNSAENSYYSRPVEITTPDFVFDQNPILIDVANGTFEMGSANGDEDEMPLFFESDEVFEYFGQDSIFFEETFEEDPLAWENEDGWLFTDETLVFSNSNMTETEEVFDASSTSSEIHLSMDVYKLYIDHDISELTHSDEIAEILIKIGDDEYVIWSTENSTEESIAYLLNDFSGQIIQLQFRIHGSVNLENFDSWVVENVKITNSYYFDESIIDIIPSTLSENVHKLYIEQDISGLTQSDEVAEILIISEDEENVIWSTEDSTEESIEFSLENFAEQAIQLKYRIYGTANSDDLDSWIINNVKIRDAFRMTELTNDFQIAETEITNAQYCQLLNWAFGKGKIKVDFFDQSNTYNYDNPSSLNDLLDFTNWQFLYNYEEEVFEVVTGMEDYPISAVTWYGAIDYSNWLSEITGNEKLYENPFSWYTYEKTGYRLPTEAEWEFAAIGGNNSNNYLYSGSSAIEDVAWYIMNCDEIQPGGTKDENELGIFDMSGNVWEWCNDYYAEYSPDDTVNPENTTPAFPYRKVIRGGSWEFGESYHRNTNRANCKSDLGYGRVNTSIGFRVVFIGE